MRRYELLFSDVHMGHPDLGWMSTVGLDIDDQDTHFVKFLENRGFTGVRMIMGHAVQVEGRVFGGPNREDMVRADETRIREIMSRAADRMMMITSAPDLMRLWMEMKTAGMLSIDDIGSLREAFGSMWDHMRGNS